MDGILQQLIELFDRTAIKLEDEVKVWQIVILIGSIIITFFIAGYMRRWFRRFFQRLKMQEHIENRLIAILFLLIMIIGIGVSFNIAGIRINLVRDVLYYDLTGLFQPSQKPIASESGEEPSDTDTGTKPELLDENRDRKTLTIASIFWGFAIVFGMFILSKYTQWILKRQVLEAFQIERHAQFIILRFFHFFLITLGIFISLSTLGISLTSVALIFGGLSIGIGFGLQTTVANLISGLILIFERPIKIGDLVEIMDVNIFGRVSSINLRSTVIVSLDEKEIIVPNSQLITEPVHNLTHYNNRFRLHIQVGVSYGSDVVLVKKILIEAAHAHPLIIKEPTADMENVTEPFVRFTRFGESSLDFELLAWIPDSFQRFDVASDLHFMIWQLFKENNIKIPFPQRDVHFFPNNSE